MQPLLKLFFFGRYPASQNSGDFQMQSPKLVDGHRFKIVGFQLHIGDPENRCPVASGLERAACTAAGSLACWTVVMVAPMTATPNATASSARMRRGAIGCSRIQSSPCSEFGWFRSLFNSPWNLKF